ncbi:MAG: 50S ribosomal protein L1 [archaeon]|nr:50S ribosomal protein L1 [archaeon]
MDKPEVIKALTELKQQPKRKFSQSYDLIINLKNIVVKQNPLDFFVTLHNSNGRKIKIAAFVDQELKAQAKEFCDLVISEEDFAKYKDKSVGRKLAREYDYFIAQANLMPKVAAAFGKALGTRGKMPNPKLGCVIPPNANLDALRTKLELTVRLTAKQGLNLQCLVGKEGQSDDEVADNILTVYNHVIKNLPNELQNVKNLYLKTTMGKPVRI